MAGNNKFGRRGAGPFAGYRSLNAWRAARRETRLKEVADRIAEVEAAEVLIAERRNAHYGAWLAAKCVTGTIKIGAEELPIECSVSALRASYCDFYKTQAKPAQSWGLWMGQHFKKVAVNSCGVGRVYRGIALKPVPQTVIPESEHAI